MTVCALHLWVVCMQGKIMRQRVAGGEQMEKGRSSIVPIVYSMHP